MQSPGASQTGVLRGGPRRALSRQARVAAVSGSSRRLLRNRSQSAALSGGQLFCGGRCQGRVLTGAMKPAKKSTSEGQSVSP